MDFNSLNQGHLEQQNAPVLGNFDRQEAYNMNSSEKNNQDRNVPVNFLKNLFKRKQRSDHSSMANKTNISREKIAEQLNVTMNPMYEGEMPAKVATEQSEMGKEEGQKQVSGIMTRIKNYMKNTFDKIKQNNSRTFQGVIKPQGENQTDSLKQQESLKKDNVEKSTSAESNMEALWKELYTHFSNPIGQNTVTIGFVTLIIGLIIVQFVFTLKSIKQYYVGKESIKQCSGNIYVYESPIHRMYQQTLNDIKKTKFLTISYATLMLIFFLYTAALFTVSLRIKFGKFGIPRWIALSVTYVIITYFLITAYIDKALDAFEPMQWIGIAFGFLTPIILMLYFALVVNKNTDTDTEKKNFPSNVYIYSGLALLVPFFLTLNIVVRNRSMKIMGSYEDKMKQIHDLISTGTPPQDKILYNYIEDISAIHNISAEQAKILIDQQQITSITPYLKTDSYALRKQLEANMKLPVTEDFYNWRNFYYKPNVYALTQESVIEYFHNNATNITYSKIENVPEVYNKVKAAMGSNNVVTSSPITGNDSVINALGSETYALLRRLTSDDVPIESYYNILDSFKDNLLVSGEHVLSFLSKINTPSDDDYKSLEEIKTNHDTINEIISLVRSVLIINQSEKDILRSQKGIFVMAFICLFVGTGVFYHFLVQMNVNGMFFAVAILLVVAIVAFLWITGAFVQS